MALRVKIGIWTHSALFECVHVDIGSISSHMRAGEVHRPTFQPFILVSFVFHHACVSWVELTVINPNSIIFIYATGLRSVHSLGVSQVWIELKPDFKIKAEWSAAVQADSSNRPSSSLFMLGDVEALQRQKYDFNLYTLDPVGTFELKAAL